MTLDGVNGAKSKKGNADSKVSLLVDLKGISVNAKDWIFTRTNSGKTALKDLGIWILHVIFVMIFNFVF